MKVLFIASGKSDNNVSPIIRNQGESLRIRGINIDYYALGNKGLTGYVKEIFRLKSYLSKNSFDILHAHYGLAAIVVLLAKRDEKLVVSFMGDDIVGSNRIDGSVTKISLIGSRINILISKYFYSHSIVKSREMMIKTAHHKVSLIPNGVDLKVFHPVSRPESKKFLGIDQKTKLVLFISDPSRTEKNYNLAIKSAALLKTEGVYLKPISGLDQNTLCKYYCAADVIILTSFHEGSPNVIKEAMACNCPIVSTKVGDVEWLITNIEGCYLALFDPIDFSEKIKAALDYSSKTGRTKGRERIIELGLNSDAIAEKIIDVYKKVLN